MIHASALQEIIIHTRRVDRSGIRCRQSSHALRTAAASSPGRDDSPDRVRGNRSCDGPSRTFGAALHPKLPTDKSHLANSGYPSQDGVVGRYIFTFHPLKRSSIIAWAAFMTFSDCMLLRPRRGDFVEPGVGANKPKTDHMLTFIGGHGDPCLVGQQQSLHCVSSWI